MKGSIISQKESFKNEPKWVDIFQNFNWPKHSNLGQIPDEGQGDQAGWSKFPPYTKTKIDGSPNNDKKQQTPNEKQSSQVHHEDDPPCKHEYLIYGKRINDQKVRCFLFFRIKYIKWLKFRWELMLQVVMSCTIKKDFQYNRVMPTFHHWKTGNLKYGKLNITNIIKYKQI